MREDDAAMRLITGSIVDAAIRVHDTLGPGLLERVYTECLAEDLQQRGHVVAREVGIPVVYQGRTLPGAFRIDLLVDGKVVVEVKAVEEVHPVHPAQLYTYLKLSGRRIGLLLNFNVRLMKDGITRIICSQH